MLRHTWARVAKLATTTRARQVHSLADHGSFHGEKPKILVLSGCTGVGKTDMAIALAHKLNAEVISADSAQVFVGMDIGTNKLLPGEIEHCGVPHHMLSVCPLSTSFDAWEFGVKARQITEDIISRGKNVIVAGGTGFYLKWYIHGPGDAPGSSVESRAFAEEKYKELLPLGVGALEKLVESMNTNGDLPVWVIDKLRGDFLRKDSYRVQRALEIAYDIQQRTGKHISAGQDVNAALDWKNKFDWRCTFLVPSDKIWLWRRVERRCEDMVEKGLIQETASLREDGIATHRQASKILGYRHALGFLETLHEQRLLLDDNEKKQSTMASFQTAFHDFLQSFCDDSRKYVRRQMTWFRGDPMFHWEALPVPAMQIPATYFKNAKRKKENIDFEKYCPALPRDAFLEATANVLELYRMSEAEYIALRSSQSYLTQQQSLNNQKNTPAQQQEFLHHRARMFVYDDIMNVTHLREELKLELNGK